MVRGTGKLLGMAVRHSRGHKAPLGTRDFHMGDAQQETVLADIQRRRAEKRRAAMVRGQAARAGSE